MTKRIVIFWIRHGKKAAPKNVPALARKVWP
jgi:hypothetical protein